MVTREDAVGRLCLAVDKVKSLGEIITLLLIFRGKVGFVKFNVAFVLAHENAVLIARAMGYKVWVDLKSEDIPDTVKGIILALREMGVGVCTIHLSGGPEMIRQAVEAAGNEMTVLGITVLTSINQKTFNEDLGMPGLISDRVMFLARLGHRNGVHGVVCSGLEVREVKNKFGSNFFAVTPGIRFETKGADRDQKRVVTPYLAAHDGSDLLVMGSDLIKGGPDAADRAVDEIYQALIDRNNELLRL